MQIKKRTRRAHSIRDADRSPARAARLALDFALGALVALSPFVRLRLAEVVALLGFTFVADVIVNRVAYYLRIRTSAW